MKWRLYLLAAAAFLALSACGVGMVEDELDEASDTEHELTMVEEAQVRSSTAFDEQFVAAGKEFNVPAGVLKAIAYVESRYEMVTGVDEFESGARVGLMGLTGERLTLGAQRAGVTVEQAGADALANVRAAAANLDALATELGIDRGQLAAWAPAIERFSGIGDPSLGQAYVQEEIFGAIKDGIGALGEGLVVPEPAESEIGDELSSLSQALTAGPDYSPAVWRYSPYYNYRPSGMTPKMVVIHTCEGGYAGCVSTLVSSGRASAHYVVNSTGSEISQLVRESHRAWHVAANYSCSLNSSVLCSLNGRGCNDFTIGIEHAGYAAQKTFPLGQLNASAKLTCNITRDRAIARDRYHVVAHGKLQPYNRTDPGPNWPWTTYLSKVNSYCAPAAPPPPSGPVAIVIDSNNAKNNQASGYSKVSRNWTSSAYAKGFYGTGYWYAKTAAVSDGAEFYFYLSADATRTIDAWWTGGTNRSTTTPILAFNAQGAKVGSKSVNQQVNGGAWRTIGTYRFTKGWNKVVVSRWTTPGKVVIADAIRVR